jgi:hypothetical protein
VGQPTTPEPDSCNLSVDSGGGGPARFAAECSLITPFVVGGLLLKARAHVARFWADPLVVHGQHGP